MTAKFYIVAYPHPEVSRSYRSLPFKLDPEDFGFTLLQQVRDAYPDQLDDLKNATLWKASCSMMAQLPT